MVPCKLDPEELDLLTEEKSNQASGFSLVQWLVYSRIIEYISPVSPVFHTIGSVRLSLN